MDLTGDRDEEEDDAAAPLRSLADLRPNEQREEKRRRKSPHLSSARQELASRPRWRRGGLLERSLYRGLVRLWARTPVGVVGTMGRAVMRVAPVCGSWGPGVGGGGSPLG